MDDLKKGHSVCNESNLCNQEEVDTSQLLVNFVIIVIAKFPCLNIERLWVELATRKK